MDELTVEFEAKSLSKRVADKNKSIRERLSRLGILKPVVDGIIAYAELNQGLLDEEMFIANMTKFEGYSDVNNLKKAFSIVGELYG